MGKLMMLPIDAIHQSKSQLREVDKESEHFKNMAASMREPAGLINPISVREVQNADTQETEYVLVDGAHRLAACRDAKYQEIACNVLDIGELDSMFAQIMGNAIKKDTKPYEFSRQCRRALAIDPSLNVGDIARRSRLREDYVRKLLKLDKLHPAVGAKVDAGKIDLISAIAITKLPEEMQGDWAEKALMAPTATEFVEALNTFDRERKKAEREGRSPEEVGFVLSPKLRKIGDYRELIEDDKRTKLKEMVKGTKNAADAAEAVMLWVLQMDEQSAAERKSAYDANIARRKKEKEKNEAEAKAKVLAKKEEEVAKLRDEMSSPPQG